MNDWMGPGLAIVVIICAVLGCAFLAMISGTEAEANLQARVATDINQLKSEGADEFSIDPDRGYDLHKGIRLTNKNSDVIGCVQIDQEKESSPNSLLKGYVESGVKRFRIEFTKEAQRGIQCSGKFDARLFTYIKFVPLEYSGQPGSVP